MATPGAVQAELDTTGSGARIMQTAYDDATYTSYYVTGRADVPGRRRWCTCTTADSAADQATAILAALAVG